MSSLERLREKDPIQARDSEEEVKESHILDDIESQESEEMNNSEEDSSEEEEKEDFKIL